VGGATFVSLLGMILPVHLTVINYKIFGNLLSYSRWPIRRSGDE